MPRYSVSGLIAAGWAGGTVSRAGKVLASPAGGACWLDETRALYARKIGEPDVWALRAHNGAVEIKIDEASANELRAGGGVWAAERGRPGVRSNRHPELPLAGLRDVGPDGTLGYCRDFNSGRGLILRALDGATTTLVGETAACRDVQVHSATEATGVQGGRLWSTYGSPATPEGRYGVPRVVLLDGQRRLLYWHADDKGERLLLQMNWFKPEGYVLTKPGQVRDGKPDWPAFRPDLIAIAGQLRACWAITEAEGPSSIRELAIDLTRPVVDLRRAAVPVPPPVPPPPPSPQTPKVTIASYLPASGPAPLLVRAVAVLSGGPAKSLLWRWKKQGGSWTLAVKNPASDSDHHFSFTTPGTYEIGVDVTGLDGKIADGTKSPRVVTVS